MPPTREHTKYTPGDDDDFEADEEDNDDEEEFDEICDLLTNAECNGRYSWNKSHVEIFKGWILTTLSKEFEDDDDLTMMMKLVI